MSSETQTRKESQNQNIMSQNIVRINAANSFVAGRYILNFKNQGFKNEHCVGEYCGNSWDAKAKNIKIIIENTPGEEGLTSHVNTIRIVDDGIGMNREKILKNYIPLHKENHTNDESTGTRGVGAKKANALLSDFTISKVISSSDGVEFTTLVQDWKKAIETNNLGDLNLLRNSTASEIAQFKADRSNMATKSGVTVVLPYKRDIGRMFQDLIKNPKQFVPERRLDILMTGSGITFKFENRSNPQKNAELGPEKCYNYFDESNDVDFVTPDGWENSIGRHTIHMYRHKDTGENEFVMRLNGNPEDQWRLKKYGGSKRYSQISKRCKDTNDWDNDDDYVRITNDGQLECLTAFRWSDDYFKVSDKYLVSASKALSNYCKNYFDSANDEFQSQIGIIRNRQRLSGVPRRNIANNARANPESRALCMTAVVLRVKTTGDSKKQDIDNIIKVDQNKQREREEDCLPRQLSTLIDYARKEHRDKVIETMRKIARKNREEEKKRKEKEEAERRAEEKRKEEMKPIPAVDTQGVGLQVVETSDDESKSGDEATDQNLLTRFVNKVVSTVMSSSGETDDEEEPINANNELATRRKKILNKSDSEEKSDSDNEVQEFSEWQQKEKFSHNGKL